MAKEIFIESAYFGVFLSLLGYGLGVFIQKKLKSPIFNPLLISIIFCITSLVFLNIDFESYNKGASYLSWLLTPATVALAIPLYEQIGLLKKNYKAVFIGIFSGVMASLISVFLLAIFFELEEGIKVSILPKSITTAIGMGLASELGGIDTLAAASIIITGIFGGLICKVVFKVFKIKNPLAMGVALGTSAHAVGTAKAFEMGEVEGAMSSLSVAVAGIMTVGLIQFFV